MLSAKVAQIRNQLTLYLHSKTRFSTDINTFIYLSFIILPDFPDLLQVPWSLETVNSLNRNNIRGKLLQIVNI